MTDRHTTEGGQKHPFSHSWLVEVRLFQLCFLDKGALAGLQLDSHCGTAAVSAAFSTDSI